MTLEFWRGDFGNKYHKRNTGDLDARIDLWGKILQVGFEPHIDMVDSILEVGAGSGVNLEALSLITEAALYAVEPNDVALERLHLIPGIEAIKGDVTQLSKLLTVDRWAARGGVDLIFTSGVLIHIHPAELLAACQEIYKVSKKYIVCIEYFSDTPEEVIYRGNIGALWKRDFGAFWLDNFDLKLLDYGFAWHRATGLDNLTWTVFEKS